MYQRDPFYEGSRQGVKGLDHRINKDIARAWWCAYNLAYSHLQEVAVSHLQQS